MPNYTIDKLHKHFETNIDELLPSQANNSGKYLTTNGSTTSWGNIDALPSQANNAGKFLTTDGTTASWSQDPFSNWDKDYNDLINTPTIPVVPATVSSFTNDAGYLTSVNWNDVGNKPTFATVATTGDYTDLINTPTIPVVPTNVSAFTNDSGYITGVDWEDVTNKPSTFTPAAHNHDGVYATPSDVSTAVANLVNSAPTTLDTLAELANALGDDPNFATTVATQIGEKLDSDSANYVKSLSISGTTITITKGDDSTSTLNTQDTTYTAGTGIDITNGVISADDQLPTQTGNSGKYLTTNGTSVSWGDVDALPSQTGNSGKYLTTNGTTASWANVDLLPDQTNNSGKYLTTDGTNAYWGSGFNSETRISSVHYPNENDTTVTLTTAQVPSENISAYNLSIYRDGVYLIKDIDYTYNTTTRVITVVNAFESEEVLYVLFSYLSDGESTGSGSGTGESLPSQTGNAGKFLTTNGTTASWAAIPSGSGSSEDEIRISSLHYPTSGATTITLTSAQNLPGTINKYALSIYRNGIYLNNTLDYTYNNSTGVITFTEAFTVDEVVVVNFAYLSSDSGTNSTYLDLAGTQTMTGSIRSNSQEVIHIANVTTTGKVITAYDDNNNLLGKLEFTKDSTGKRFVNIQSVDGNLSSQLSIVTDSTNTNTYITGPSISDVNDNSNKLATTSYVHLANNDRFGIATERVVNLIVDDNNLTINPSLGTLVKATLNGNTSVIINAPRSLYTNNGSTIGLHITLTDENSVISWPQNVKWPDDTAPDLGYINIITFMTFDGGTTWYASLYVASSTFPSA